jgi:hypothetical protein
MLPREVINKIEPLRLLLIALRNNENSLEPETSADL